MNQLSLDIDDVHDSDDRQLLTQLRDVVTEISVRIDVLTEIRAHQVALDDRLWKVYDIAAYLQTSERNARYFINQRGAPRPVEVPNGRGAIMKARYYPDEVKEFIKRKGRINSPASAKR